jgi:hypothetical protein
MTIHRHCLNPPSLIPNLSHHWMSRKPRHLAKEWYIQVGHQMTRQKLTRCRCTLLRGAAPARDPRIPIRSIQNPSHHAWARLVRPKFHQSNLRPNFRRQD